MVSKNQLIISCIFNGLNFIMLIYYLYDIILIHTIDLEHITRLSYYFNSFFTTVCLICDVFLYFSDKEGNSIESQSYKLMSDNGENENKDMRISIEKLNDWNRNHYGVIFNSFGYFVLIGFWLLYFFGNSVMLVSKNVRSWFNSYYHHLVIQIITVIDIFASDRKRIEFSWNQFSIIGGLYIIYCVAIAVEKYIFGRNSYYFMEGKSAIYLTFCAVLTSFFLYLCYWIHILLIELKFKLLKKESIELNKKQIFAEDDLYNKI